MSYLQAYASKTILVTGGAGAIGSNLTRRLAELGAQVITLDDLSSGVRWNVPSLPGILFVEGDILDEVKLKRVFFERPQIVFHLAAFFANQNSVDHPERDLMVNGLGTLRLLEYSVFTGVERFVYASSGCSIYGSNASLPLREEFMSMHLSIPYQITKMLYPISSHTPMPSDSCNGTGPSPSDTTGRRKGEKRQKAKSSLSAGPCQKTVYLL